MKKILLGAVLFLLTLVLLSCATARVGTNVVMDKHFIGQAVFLTAKMKDEFAGCVFGQVRKDTIYADMMVVASMNPDNSTPNAAHDWTCINIARIGDDEESWDVQVLGLVHNHPGQGNCLPSPVDFQFVQTFPKLIANFIVCAEGRGIVAYNEHGIMFVVEVPSNEYLYNWEESR